MLSAKALPKCAKPWVQSPVKGKYHWVPDSLPVEALKGRAGEAEPNFTQHLLPAHHCSGPVHARAIGGPQPFTVLENTQSFPFPSSRLLKNADAPVLQELGSKELQSGPWVGSSPMLLFLSSSGGGLFDACRLWGVRPITEALGVCLMPFATPPFSTCFQILQEDQGESSKSRLSQEQKFFN